MSLLISTTFRLYDIAWRTALPFLKRNHRIAEGFSERQNGPALVDAPVDLWLQAASAGEAYLAISIVEKLSVNKSYKILVTTNTRQGFDILKNLEIRNRSLAHKIFISYFPFDRPSTISKVVARITPRLTVLLETELWPGLLMALKKQNLPAIIINGRLSPKSLRNYLLFPQAFRAVAPRQILTISNADATRYSQLFNTSPVATMANIKFDRITFPESSDQNPLHQVLGKTPDLMVLGSVREAEEPLLEQMIPHLLRHLPQVRIAVFPRHMYRLDAWRQMLSKKSLPWVLRSTMSQAVAPGTVILWDTFGELSKAYALAKSVFVGGSLTNLGGQNFIEPLAYGVRPVIGPYWDNFLWVGEDIFTRRLVKRCSNWQAVATALIEDFQSPSDSKEIIYQAKNYIQERQGGTQKAVDLIESYFN